MLISSAMFVAAIFAIGYDITLRQKMPLTVFYIEHKGIDLTQYSSPSPELSPANVVDIQLNALKHNNAEDSGIAVAFKFASNAIKKTPAAFSSFAAVIKSSQYESLMHFSSFRKMPLRYHYKAAIQLVEVEEPGGERSVYMFVLKRSNEDPTKGCWLLESLRKVDEEPNYPLVQKREAESERPDFANKQSNILAAAPQICLFTQTVNKLRSV